MGEKAEVKSEKVKVTLSVHQVVNYTQEVELYPFEKTLLESAHQNQEVVDKIIKRSIDHKVIYDHCEYLDYEILEDS